MAKEYTHTIMGEGDGCGYRCAHAFHFNIPGCLACPGTFRVASKPCYKPAPTGMPCRVTGRKDNSV